MSSLLRAFLVAGFLLTLLTALPLHAAPKEEAPEKSADAKEKEDKGPKPYAEVITEKMTSTAGLFTVHRDGDEVYFEIPAAELGKEMLWVTQIAETQAGFSWAGMPVGDRVVRWERSGDKILLRDVNYDIRADVQALAGQGGKEGEQAGNGRGEGAIHRCSPDTGCYWARLNQPPQTQFRAIQVFARPNSRPEAPADLRLNAAAA